MKVTMHVYTPINMGLGDGICAVYNVGKKESASKYVGKESVRLYHYRTSDRISTSKILYSILIYGKSADG